LQLKIRHIAILSIVLSFLAALLCSAFNVHLIAQNNQHRAETVVSNMLQLRSVLLNQNDTGAITRTLLKHEQALNRSLIRVSVYSGRPYSGQYLSNDQRLLTSSEFDVLVNALLANQTIQINTPLDGHQWLVMQSRYFPQSAWTNLIPIFLTIITLIIVLWTLFILYYHYTLPRDVMDLLVGEKQTLRLNDRLINSLREHLRSYFNEKTLMITALAHDIKTPLTEAMLRLEFLEDSKEAARIKQKLESVNNIVRSSLEYAKQPDKIRKVEVDLVSLLENITEEARQREFDIDYTHYVDHFNIKVELPLFKRAIMNLIENAMKYATSCQIVLEQVNRNVVQITCQDNGPGVPDEFLDVLSVPYFRVDQARSTESGGSGLGLAIVKKIIDLHHGKLGFENLLGGGFRVIITLDKRKQQNIESFEEDAQ